MRRHELTDHERELLAPLIPRAVTGRPRAEDPKIINGMVYKIRMGISWRDLPTRYGPWKTVYTRFRRYALDGVCTRALQQIQAQADEAGDIDWLVQIDSTIVRAHQHAASTILITPGQRHDNVCAPPLLERIRVPRTGLGRPRCRPDRVIADTAYSSRGFRAYLAAAASHTIPEKTDQQRHRLGRGRHGGRPPEFDRETYRRRNTVERCFNRLKGFCGLATRYNKTAVSYEAAVTLASFLLWARSV
ncbi:transposase [Streptomyces sp. GMR22]|nr:transposase [Streptomyces sp. GMR22]MBA6433071.1 transposase [Streptomyces sp. GMR22]